MDIKSKIISGAILALLIASVTGGIYIDKNNDPTLCDGKEIVLDIGNNVQWCGTAEEASIEKENLLANLDDFKAPERFYLYDAWYNYDTDFKANIKNELKKDFKRANLLDLNMKAYKEDSDFAKNVRDFLIEKAVLSEDGKNYDFDINLFGLVYSVLEEEIKVVELSGEITEKELFDKYIINKK